MPSDNFVYDTNLFIYYLNGNLHVEKFFTSEFLSSNNVYYSIITEIELLSFPKLTDNEINSIKSFLNGFIKINLNEDIKDKTIAIRKKHKAGLGDSIIAASSIIYQARLVTRNIDDFLKISDLVISNPFE
ncbi:MAG: type II toxin-antitoxin system VapC family toxin [Ignavibacteriaceae bacterium]|nr:type II toxin-antitoxin system VapC family toxin [Ignavibacteriaceae bacterium]